MPTPAPAIWCCASPATTSDSSRRRRTCASSSDGSGLNEANACSACRPASGLPYGGKELSCARAKPLDVPEQCCVVSRPTLRQEDRAHVGRRRLGSQVERCRLPSRNQRVPGSGEKMKTSRRRFLGGA